MKKKKLLRAAGLLTVVLVASGAGVYAWASVTTGRILSATIDTHASEFPIPFPLDEAEIAELGLDGAQAEALAFERARDRGRHLVTARYACTECHGADFGGGVMLDAPIMGRLLGPNITSGVGSRTSGYTSADWDRTVRHGVLPDGRPTPMPSEDFQLMSDQELSDIVVYIQSQPPVDNEVPPVTLGPLGKILMATGQLHLSAQLIEAHDVEHAPLPPTTEASVEFGRHLGGVCTGCHGADLAGGPIPGGDPSWAPARNLTPHESGLAGWTYDEFVAAMRGGTRPDGSALLPPMTAIAPYARSMTDIEMEALWMFLQSVPPVER